MERLETLFPKEIVLTKGAAAQREYLIQYPLCAWELEADMKNEAFIQKLREYTTDKKIIYLRPHQ